MAPASGFALRRFLAAAAAALALGGVLASCSYLDVKQRELIFRATKVPAPVIAEPARAYAPAPEVEEVWLDVPGSADRVHGWWWPSAAGPAAPAVLYLHGVRRDLTGNSYRIARLAAMGFNILAIDYRGFGRSGGDIPDERWTYEDAELAWKSLRERTPASAKRIIYGHSLGGAVGIELATRVGDASALVVESTFTSMRDMADLTLARFLPVRLILTQRYDSLAKIERVRIPTLFVHGTSDRFVPYDMSVRLHAAAVAPKRLLLVENGTHGNTLATGFESCRSAIAELMGLARPAVAGQPTNGEI